MTSTTTKYLLPYPDNTDPVANGDDTIKALAQRLDLLLGETGTRTIVPSAADVTQSVRVNFSRDYSAIGVPKVFAMEDNLAGTATTIHIWITGEDATGFTLNLRSGSTSSRDVRWWCRGA